MNRPNDKIRIVYEAMSRLIKSESKIRPFVDRELADLVSANTGFEVDGNRIWYYRKVCGLKRASDRRKQYIKEECNNETKD